MKQIRHIFLIILCALAYATGAWAWGENTSYVLDKRNDAEITIKTTGKTSAFALNGPADTLFFEARRNFGLVNYAFWAEYSKDGGNTWNDALEAKHTTSYQEFKVEIPNDATHIRFEAKVGSTYHKYVRNIRVTRATSFSSSTSSLDFGNVRKNESKDLNAVVHYQNTTYNQQVTRNNAPSTTDFTVEPTIVGETSYTGTWATNTYTSSGKNVKITFTPTKLGYQSETVQLIMNGEKVVVTVTGTGITTYYVSSSVTAKPAAGGNAYTSFTTANPTSGSTATKNSGDVSTADATTNVYFNAVPNSNYVFKGWTASTATSYNSVSPVSSITYNSENSSSPTSIAYKAWFAPLCNFSATALVGNVAGGTVKVSAGNTILENATTTATANGIEGAPGETSASTTFTFSATPAQGYEFVGWGTTAGATTYESSNATYSKSVTNNSPGSTAPTTLYAIFREKTITLDPATTPSYTSDFFKTVSLQRTLPAGYSSIALPFGTTVGAIVGGGYNSTNDWVAQLTTVTYNAQDDYTLYFTMSNGGAIAANQPYVLHLGTEVVSPSWTDLTVNAPAATTKTPTGYGTAVSPFGDAASDWSMSSNFTAGMSMNGKYGIVNTGANNQNGQGGLKLGGSGSTLNAFSAYVTPPASVLQGNKVLRIRAAYVDSDGTITYIDSPTTDVVGEAQQKPVAIYGSDGQRRPHMQRGLNIVRYADGTTRKVMY